MRTNGISRLAGLEGGLSTANDGVFVTESGGTCGVPPLGCLDVVTRISWCP